MTQEQLQKFYLMAEPLSDDAIHKAEERKLKSEDKGLLLKDLCARLPYGVHIRTNNKKILKLWGICPDDINGYWVNSVYELDEVKPYLRPMSSMTEEEREELKELTAADILTNNGFGYENLRGMCFGMMYIDCQEIIDWLNAHHFDYRGLIDKGLAIDCTDLNVY